MVGLNSKPDYIELSGRKAIVRGKDDRVKPELANMLFPSDMNMSRFIAIKTVEIEPVRPLDVLDRGHERFTSTSIPTLHKRLKDPKNHTEPTALDETSMIGLAAVNGVALVAPSGNIARTGDEHES